MRQLLVFLFFAFSSVPSILLPFNAKDRSKAEQIKLTDIGAFGLVRKARATVPSHLHTGIDIRRPGKNYDNEPVYPLMNGKVISKRTDGAYAQLILEHELKGKKIWTLYEHIAGICVKLNEKVDVEHPIARFMNKTELDKYGWQFDHFHLEVLKKQPFVLKPDKLHPERMYSAPSLICFDKSDLDKYYYEPLAFIKENI